VGNIWENSIQIFFYHLGVQEIYVIPALWEICRIIKNMYIIPYSAYDIHAQHHFAILFSNTKILAMII